MLALPRALERSRPDAVAEEEVAAGAEEAEDVEPLQLTQLAAAVRWTAQVEAAFAHAAQGTPLPSALAQVEEERGRALPQLQARLRAARTPRRRARLQAALLAGWREREATRELREAGGAEGRVQADSWEWLRQQRAYLEPAEPAAPRCALRLGLSSLEHGYEYMGAARLALTPSTARCQLALLATFAAHAGGVLVGAAGAGKTEAARDLASMAGRYLVAVHCARQLPTASLHRLVRGAAGAGLWLLLEEVAALPQPSLLLLAQQARANRSPLPSGFPLA